MKNKVLVPVLLIAGLLSLSACSLFNDDDLAYTNVYNDPEPEAPVIDYDHYTRGVQGKIIEATPNAYCYKNICYAENEKIINTYKEGGENYLPTLGYNVNNGEDYFANKSSNNYDLYVPNSVAKNAEHTVLLFIHGGAWVSGFKTSVNQYVHEFANRGYITATVKYKLLDRKMDNPSLSIFRDLDEIDACIASIKLALEELHFDTTKTSLVIGGASSGAHLTMLYAYSRGHKSALPIEFLVDAVGPVEIKPRAWKTFKVVNDAVLNAGLTSAAIEQQELNDNLGRLSIAEEKDDDNNPVYWNDYQTMRIANGMCGLPNSVDDVKSSSSNKETINNPNAASTLMTKDEGGEDLLSVTYWINHTTNNFKIICAYAGMDNIIGIAQYAQLEKALDAKGIEHSELHYFKDSNHTEITAKKNPTAYNGFIGEINEWLEAL